jgi:hypothetical protein
LVEVKTSNALALISTAFADVALLPEDSLVRNDELFPPGTFIIFFIFVSESKLIKIYRNGRCA